jgi:peptidase S46-like protein
LKNGFYAKAKAEEIKCADLELNVLVSIEDVTAQVNGAVKTGMSADAAGKARDDLACMIDRPAREARAAHDAEEEIKRQAYAEIAKARVAVEGTSRYPDATLRCAYRTAKL